MTALHCENIAKLCRFCGEFVLTKKEKVQNLQPNSCFKFADKIQKVWGVDVGKDRKEQHPPYFCNSCRARLYKPPKHSHPKRVSWYKHTYGDECRHCEKVGKMSRGGRRKRGKSSGRPKAPKENSPKEDSPKENKESPQAKQSKQQPTSSAPRPVQVLMVIPPPPPPSVLILPPVTVQSNCSFGKVTVTLDEEGPLSPDEDMAFTAMLRRKLEGSSDKTFVAKTGGKPMRFMHTPQLEKTSTDAAPSTVAKRARMLESMREQVSGGNGEHQLMAEMKRYPKDQLFQMLDKAGLAQIRIPTGHLLLSAYEVTAELLPFSVKTDDDEVIIALRPCAYIFSLPSAVFDYTMQEL